MVVPVLFAVLVYGNGCNQNKCDYHPKNHGDKNSGTQGEVCEQLKSNLDFKGNNYHAKINGNLASSSA
tara:strand:- start:487 stop:690 length:204 start_codon:yes stop_codon:yes gene_type:complete